MATLALSPDDCDRLARATRMAARAITVAGESSRHLKLAAYLEDAAAAERQPRVPDAWADRTPAQRGPPPPAADTFPVCAEGDGIERCVAGRDKHPGCHMSDDEAYGADPAAWGDSPHDQEPSA